MSILDLQAQRTELATKRKEMETRANEIKNLGAAAIIAFRDEEMPRRVEELKSLTATLEASKSMDEELARNRDELKSISGLDRRYGISGGSSDGAGTSSDIARQDFRSVGQMFVDSQEFKTHSGSTDVRPIKALIAGADPSTWTTGGHVSGLDSIKATLSDATGYAPFIPRSPRLIPIAQLPPVIADLIPQENTDVPGGKYMEETLYTNNADLTLEGGLKPEAALGFAERSFSMAKIAVTLPVTDEQLADVPQIRGIIDNRLGLMVRQTEDRYLLTNVAANGFDGFLVNSGVQAVSGATGAIPTNVLKAITLIEFQPGFATVTGLVMNPLDWQTYVTYQVSTGAYLLGSPMDSPINTMWGMPIVRTNRMPQGTILLGDFRTYSEILRRQELQIDVGWINDDFSRNIQRIRAEERMVLQIFRAAAFAKITGVPAPA